jgi:hypothetical protein
MKTHPQLMGYVRRFGLLVAMILSVVPARANPIELPEKSITPEVSMSHPPTRKREEDLKISGNQRCPNRARSERPAVRNLRKPEMAGRCWRCGGVSRRRQHERHPLA